jgi:glutamine synthetase
MSLVERAGLAGPTRREQTTHCLARIEASGIRYVRMAFPDLLGVLRGRAVQVERLKAMFEEGMSFGCRLLLCDLTGDVHPSVQLGETYDFGNFYLLPDPTTFVPLPWSPGAGLILADPYLPGGEPAVSSRLLLQRAIAQAAALDLKLLVGFEIEATIYPIGDVPPFSERRHLFTTLGQGLAAPLLNPLWDALSQMGLELDAYANEFAAGEIEFNLAPRLALAAVDQFALVKLAAQEMFKTAGYGITFMAMFDNEHGGMTSGLHIHQAALNGTGQNIFYDPAAEDGLSILARHYLGGQLRHACQVAVLSTPTITGYRRYRPGTWAPTSVSWSLDNRTTMLRVMPDRGADTRIENRLADSAANPYLAVAAMLAAGIDGIQRRIEPGPPTTGNATTPQVALPRNMAEALSILAQPSALTDFLGSDFLTAYCGLLRQTVERFETHVTEWEINEYRGIL